MYDISVYFKSFFPRLKIPAKEKLSIRPADPNDRLSFCMSCTLPCLIVCSTLCLLDYWVSTLWSASASPLFLLSLCKMSNVKLFSYEMTQEMKAAKRLPKGQQRRPNSWRHDLSKTKEERHKQSRWKLYAAAFQAIKSMAQGKVIRNQLGKMSACFSSD